MTLTDRDHAVCAAVADVVPTMLRRSFPLEQYGGVCLIATRVGIETLRYFGVRSEPVTLSVMAGNRRWAEWVQTPEASAETFPEEAWNVGAGQPNAQVVRGIDRRNERGYDAHLAIVVPDEAGATLLDLDAGQFSRPERGIHVPPAVTLAWDGEVAGLDLDEGGVLLYWMYPQAPRYRQALDWRKSKDIAGPAIRAVRDRLEGADEQA